MLTRPSTTANNPSAFVKEASVPMATRMERWTFELGSPPRDHGAGVFRLLKRERHVLVPSRAAYEPPTDLYETESEIIVRLEIAGLQPTRPRTTVELRDDLLTIRGERDDPAAGTARHYEQMEIATGRFERTVHLPAPVDPAGASAAYDDGFLAIRLPKSQPVRSIACNVLIE